TSRRAPSRPRWPRRSRPTAAGSRGQRYRAREVFLDLRGPEVEVGRAGAGQARYLGHALVTGTRSGTEQDRHDTGRGRVGQVRAPGDRAAGDRHLRVGARVAAVEREVVAATGERVAEPERGRRVLVLPGGRVVEVREGSGGVPVR